MKLSDLINDLVRQLACTGDHEISNRLAYGPLQSLFLRPQPNALTTAMHRIEHGAWRGALVGFRELRLQFPELAKNEFDAAALDAAAAGLICLHTHDMPNNIPQEQRDQLVTDGRGNFYVGCAIRPQ